MSDERDRGILTPADRAYLRGERTYDREQSERNTRARIRDRVYDGLVDFETLTTELSERDRQLVVERLDEAGPAGLDALAAAVAFVHGVARETELSVERVFAEGISLAAAADDRGVTVDLDLTYHELSPAGLRRKAEAGERLTLTDIAYADRHPEIDPAEFAALAGARSPSHDQRPENAPDDDRVQAKVTDF